MTHFHPKTDIGYMGSQHIPAEVGLEPKVLAVGTFKAVQRAKLLLLGV